MMQSILSTNAVKPQNNERLSDASPLGVEATASNLEAEKSEVKSRFSDLFDSLLGGDGKESVDKDKGNKNLLVEGHSEQEGQVDNQVVAETVDAQLADATEEQEIFGDGLLLEPVQNVDHVDNADNADNIESDMEVLAIQQPDFDPRLMEDREDDKLSALRSEQTDDHQDGEGVVGQNQTAILAQPSIIEQIEAAKKIDTQVIETKKMAKVNSTPPELASEIKKGQEKQPGNVKEALSGAETSSLKTPESDKNSAPESLKTETAQAIMNKVDPFSLASNSEIDRNSLTSPIDASAPRAANMDVSNLSKSINQNLAAATQSPALDQPLDLQAKHASALLGERILMMIKDSKQEVSIRLDPAELGSMHIKLQVQQDQVQLTIHTQVAQSRDIIEQNLPRLREQLAQQGVSLGETSVEQQSQQQNHNHQGKNGVQESGRMPAGDSSLQAMTDKTEWIASKIALPAQGIDYYA